MNAKELILKVAALAQQGVGGEKENAEALLHRLLKANNMTLEDLESAKNSKRERMFFIGKPYFKSLLAQIIFKVPNVNNYSITDYKLLKKIGVNLTDGEFVRVSMLFEIYSAALQRERQRLMKRQEEERKILFTAFIHKHELYSNQPNKNKKTALSEDEISKILQAMRNLENVQVCEELPGHLLEVKNDIKRTNRRCNR